MLNFIATDQKHRGLCIRDRVEVTTVNDKFMNGLIGIRGIIDGFDLDLYGFPLLHLVLQNGDKAIVYASSVVKINYYETTSKSVTFH